MDQHTNGMNDKMVFSLNQLRGILMKDLSEHRYKIRTIKIGE